MHWEHTLIHQSFIQQIYLKVYLITKNKHIHKVSLEERTRLSSWSFGWYAMPGHYTATTRHHWCVRNNIENYTNYRINNTMPRQWWFVSMIIVSTRSLGKLRNLLRKFEFDFWFCCFFFVDKTLLKLCVDSRSPSIFSVQFFFPQFLCLPCFRLSPLSAIVLPCKFIR